MSRLVLVAALGLGLSPTACGPVRAPLEGEFSLRDASVTINGGVRRAGIGTIVAAGGDLDADGTGDLLIGAPLGDAGWPGLYVDLGPHESYQPLYRAEARVLNREEYDRIGSTLLGDLDLNGDGLDDLVVGAPGVDPGTLLVFYGPVEGELTVEHAAARLTGEAGGRLGEGPLATAGDLDGDGNDDLVVGIPNHSGGGAGYHSGAAYVVRGPIGGSWDLARADAKIVGRWDGFGGSLAVLRNGGDDATRIAIGGEGPEVSVFAPPFEGDIEDTRRSGSIDLSSLDWAWPGSIVSEAGDVTGDGEDDLLVRAAERNPEDYSSWTSFLLFEGPIDRDFIASDAVWHLIDEPTSPAWACAGVGDFDGDGYDDLLFSGRQSLEDGLRRPVGWLFYGPLSGGATLADADAVLLAEEEHEDGYGAGIARAGDLDRDGFDDLIVGDPTFNGGYWGSGRIYVMLGRSR